MENLKEVFIPNEMRFRAEEISKYSKPELVAHLYVANLLGDEGRRINEFTIHNMRVESGRCIMTCLKKDDGRWSEADVEGLEHAHCDAELMNVQPKNNFGNEAAQEESVQMEVAVPLYILREIEERCKVEIELISRDVFRKTGRVIMDLEEEERNEESKDNVRNLRRGVREDMKKVKIAA